MDCAYNKNQSNGKKRAFCAIAAFLINAHHITRRYQLECVSKKIITLKNKMVVMMLMVAIEDILLKRASSNRKEFVVFIDYDDNMMDDDDSRQRSALIMKNRFIASSAAEF